MTPQEEERAAIVAWLREQALKHFESDRIDPMFALDEVADAIERLDHLPTKDR